MKTLRDVAPRELTLEYTSTRAFKMRDVTVVREYSSLEPGYKPWPGKERNVHVWWVLANGKAVGWNENPARGWGFPVIAYKEA